MFVRNGHRKLGMAHVIDTHCRLSTGSPVTQNGNPLSS